MDEHVMERDGERKALGASLLLHLILFLTAAAMGLFSVANPTGKGRPLMLCSTMRGVMREAVPQEILRRLRLLW